MFLLGSCTEVIDISLDSSYSRLVVFGEITTDSLPHEIQLTRSTDYFYNQPPPVVSNANVILSFDDKSLTLIEDPERPGHYVPPVAFRGVSGTLYELRISNVDIDEDGIGETYNASSRMPRPGSIDSIALEKIIAPFFSGYQVLLYGSDPPSLEWYNYKLSRNGIPLNANLADYTVQPDEFVVNGRIYGLPVGFLNDDDEQEAVAPGDTILLEVNSITEEFYDFITEAQNELFGNNPLFSGPPANVKSNIDNGALGIFTTCNITRKTTIAK